ncbi:SpoIIIAH-like family protein [Vallitalea okinawensis]|uniref:SpoIIIAH-like family protein n=1 Tax=Vallitalea okinawensis TaxID=2078660 RepID=UPI000CFDC3E3|nr:SpoIIIAH-like family protein [Vallitalea okinawensis]
MYNAKKNQIIITALVIMIIIAGYINYNDKVEETMSDNVGVNHEAYETNSAISEELAFDPIFEVPDVTVPTNANGADNAEQDGDENEEKEGTDSEEEVNVEESNKDDIDQPGAAVLVDSSAVVSSHFSQLKLSREQTRAKSIDNIYNVINNNDVSQEDKADAAQRLLDFNDRMIKETDAEALVKSKGFDQVYVCIAETGLVNVVVDKQELSQQDIAKITDAVRRATGKSVEEIHISSFRPQS